MDISALTQDLEVAVFAVVDTKQALVDAQAVLDEAKTAHEAALTKARDLHGALQAQIANIVPGLKK